MTLENGFEASSAVDNIAETLGFQVDLNAHPQSEEAGVDWKAPEIEPVEETFVLGGLDIHLKMDESGEVLACIPDADKCFPIGTGEDTFKKTKDLLNSLSEMGKEENGG